MATQPLSCARCNTSWVPGLDRPAGNCAPLMGRAARTLRRWQVYVSDAMMPIVATSYQPRDQATGRFVSEPAAGIEIRMAGLVRHLRLLNRLYDVPPPSALELLGRHSTGTAVTQACRDIPLAREDWQTGASPYARDGWPHFGDDFLAYEHVLRNAGHGLFGDTQRFASIRLTRTNRYDEVVVHTRDMDADHATALGWSISWYGFSRTCAPDDMPSIPAVGLTGWLAHLPHRPVDVSPGCWRDQMLVWLSEDLASSAWAWSRIVRFMRGRGKYLLHGQLARPAGLAALRRRFQRDV